MRNISFLVVDDCHTIIRLVCKVIENRLGSKKIFEAADGAEAIKILESEAIDMILSDWEMPNVSGEEFLYYVRNKSKLKEIPFIMMTSHEERDFIITAIQNGVSNYVVKPFTPEKLEDAIRKSWNSAKKRSDDRHASLPNHQVIVKIKDKSFPAQVLNISRTGALIRMKYNEAIKLFGKYELSL